MREVIFPRTKFKIIDRRQTDLRMDNRIVPCKIVTLEEV